MRKLIEIAASQVGVHEQGGNNKGPEVQMYQKSTWMAPKDVAAGFAWCAAFMSWCLQQWLATDEGKQFCIKHYITNPEAWRCRDASAFGWQTWGTKQGCMILKPTELAKAGDFVIFDFNGPNVPGGGHIGLVEHDQIHIDQIFTIEGNTGAAGLRETTDGSDGVFRKVRKNSSVKCFVRLVA